jgi:hypothetical protein
MADPDLLGLAAPVTLPRVELVPEASERPRPRLGIDRKPRGPTEGKPFGLPAGDRDREQLMTRVRVVASAAQEDARAVGRPADGRVGFQVRRRGSPPSAAITKRSRFPS